MPRQGAGEITSVRAGMISCLLKQKRPLVEKANPGSLCNGSLTQRLAAGGWISSSYERCFFCLAMRFPYMAVRQIKLEVGVGC